MGANIQELAESALGRLAKADEGVSILRAIEWAIKGKGIFHPPDIKRITKEVVRELESRKRGAKKSKFDQYPPNVQQAARGFSSWAAAQNRLAKDLKINFKFVVNYRKLTRYVYMYIESTYAHLPKADRPDVFEVEACLRSLNAQKAAKTRRENKERAKRPLTQRERNRIAAKELRDQQQDLFKL